MGKNKEKLNIFLLHFLERLNSNEPNERKVIESLTDFCNYYDFTKGFIYQTDGFRYFLLKETIGNEGGTMKPRFDMGELKKEHVDAMKARDKPFYTRVRDKDCVKNRVKRAKIVRFTLC